MLPRKPRNEISQENSFLKQTRNYESCGTFNGAIHKQSLDQTKSGTTFDEGIQEQSMGQTLSYESCDTFDEAMEKQLCEVPDGNSIVAVSQHHTNIASLSIDGQQSVLNSTEDMQNVTEQSRKTLEVSDNIMSKLCTASDCTEHHEKDVQININSNYETHPIGCDAIRVQSDAAMVKPALVQFDSESNLQSRKRKGKLSHLVKTVSSLAPDLDCHFVEQSQGFEVGSNMLNQHDNCSIFYYSLTDCSQTNSESVGSERAVFDGNIPYSKPNNQASSFDEVADIANESKKRKVNDTQDILNNSDTICASVENTDAENEKHEALSDGNIPFSKPNDEASPVDEVIDIANESKKRKVSDTQDILNNSDTICASVESIDAENEKYEVLANFSVNLNQESDKSNPSVIGSIARKMLAAFGNGLPQLNEDICLSLGNCQVDPFFLGSDLLGVKKIGNTSVLSDSRNSQSVPHAPVALIASQSGPSIVDTDDSKLEGVKKKDAIPSLTKSHMKLDVTPTLIKSHKNLGVSLTLTKSHRNLDVTPNLTKSQKKWNVTPTMIESQKKSDVTPTIIESQKKLYVTPTLIKSHKKWDVTPATIESQKKSNITPTLIMSHKKSDATPTIIESQKKSDVTPNLIEAEKKSDVTSTLITSHEKSNVTPTLIESQDSQTVSQLEAAGTQHEIETVPKATASCNAPISPRSCKRKRTELEHSPKKITIMDNNDQHDHVKSSGPSNDLSILGSEEEESQSLLRVIINAFL